MRTPFLSCHIIIKVYEKFRSNSLASNCIANEKQGIGFQQFSYKNCIYNKEELIFILYMTYLYQIRKGDDSASSMHACNSYSIIHLFAFLVLSFLIGLLVQTTTLLSPIIKETRLYASILTCCAYHQYHINLDDIKDNMYSKILYDLIKSVSFLGFLHFTRPFVSFG